MKNDIEIVAEIAQGYEGDEKLAELLTTAAIACGADAVKYQLVYADELATPDYQYYDLFKQLEMSSAVWSAISKRIHENAQKVYFDIFGLDSLAVAKNVKADGVKLSTTEFYNRDLIVRALEQFDKIFISVGGIPVDDIDKLVASVLNPFQDKICLMVGLQSEPTPLDQNNLLKFHSFKNRYPNYQLGFMDHSDGGSEDAFHLPLIALGMGISVIEKHLTLDRLLEIEDFVSGVAPQDFKHFVHLIKHYQLALGSESLELSTLETEYRKKATKVVVALTDLKKGQLLGKNDVGLKRTGIKSDSEFIRSLDNVLQKTLNQDVAKDSPIFQEQL